MAGIFGMIGAAAGLGPKKPDVPGYKPVDVQAEQSKAIAGNLAALPGAEAISSNLNLFNAQQLQSLLGMAMPNYAGIQKQTSQDILDMLQGKIPDAAQVSARAASKAVAGGYGGSEAARNLTLRDLNIDTLKYTDAGLTAANRWVQTSASVGVPQMYNPAGQLATLPDYLRTAQFNTENQWNRDWLASRVAAQPSYLEQQAMGTLDWFDSLGKSVLASYVGMETGSIGTMMSGGKFGSSGTGPGAGGTSGNFWDAPANQGFDSAAPAFGSAMFA